ncbi:MAG: hypothetical protein JRJ62_16285 [Deltaproteobacteria bacterium]|nr:hypothetical protein [Deltaproteobacteria bacterium]
MDGVRIKFFAKSFQVLHPVVTPNVLFVRTPIDEEFRKEITMFITTLVNGSMKLGQRTAQEDMQRALGIRQEKV